MKNYKHILEAINRGIKFALDDFEDQDDIQGQVNSKVKYNNGTKEWLDLMNEVVDLGLPSGTLWCKYNLEAYPELDPYPWACDFYGNYYSWGETKVKGDYQFDTLIFVDDERNLTKYCEKDGLTQLLPEDDAAYQFKKCHNFKFHIPTKEQCEELLKYTDKQWVTDFKFKRKPIKGLNGILFISKINGNSLFFPAAGYMDVDHTKNKKISGEIWTSTNAFGQDDIVDYHKAYLLHFDSDFGQSSYIDIDYRGKGLPIRPVINL